MSAINVIEKEIQQAFVPTGIIEVENVHDEDPRVEVTVKLTDVMDDLAQSYANRAYRMSLLLKSERTRRQAAWNVRK